MGKQSLEDAKGTEMGRMAVRNYEKDRKWTNGRERHKWSLETVKQTKMGDMEVKVVVKNSYSQVQHQ
jgi:hypothetical protein